MDKAAKDIYNEKYYNSHCGQEYKRNNGWEEIFGNYSDRIVREINPKKTLDVGCAIGFFVESLYDRGVDAYGIDISDYAIKNVREDIKERCKVQSALIPINEKYDLITCIEVLEHLDNKDIPIAIQRMCESTEDIIFSSTPFDYDEESHISIHAPEYWAEQFAYNGFYHDVSYDCSYISVQAMRFRKMQKSKVELIRDYEHQIFQKHQEVVSLRHLLSLSQDNVDIYKKAYQEHVDVINRELNPKILELKKELDECTIKQKKESEEAWQSKIQEEVLKRKEFEELYYEYQRLYLEEKELGKSRLNLNRSLTKDYRSDQFFPMEANRIIKLRNCLWWKLWKKKHKAYTRDFWNPVFDAKFYSERYDDLKKAFGDDEEALFNHFLDYGILEGRWANEEFDVIAYLQANIDLRCAFKYNLPKYYIHYLRYGINEGRVCRR